MRGAAVMRGLPALAALLVATASLGLASRAPAAVLPVDGTLTLQIGTLPAISVTGFGTASSMGPVVGTTLPKGLFELNFSTPIEPALLGLLGTIKVTGQNQPGTFTGAGGAMGLNANAILGANVVVIPLHAIGNGGTSSFTALGGLLVGTIFATAWQVADTTVTGNFGDPPTVLTGDGFDNRTAGGGGTLQMVSPTRVKLFSAAFGLNAVLPSVAHVTLRYRVPDSDGDGVPDPQDNCPEVSNPGQADTDADGTGDACNEAGDGDGDEWADELDNCPAVANADQANADGDVLGDACDNCPGTPNAQQEDADGDGVGDACDTCELVANPRQSDADGDGIGNHCECGDITRDGYVDARDARALQLCAVGARPCTALCDANDDGRCNTVDARLVQRFAVGSLAKTDLRCAQRP